MIPYFTLGDRVISFYAIFIILGIGAAVLAALVLCKRDSIEPYDLICSAIYALVAAFTGAKLLFVAVNLGRIIRENLYLQALIGGGFVFYGGLAGGILGLWLYCKQYRLSFAHFARLFVTVIPIGHAFGRIGCLFGGCCYGLPYDGPLAIHYAKRLSADTPLNTPLFPIQAVEALLLLLIFALLLARYLRSAPTAQLIGTYFLTYGIGRFGLEFFRGDRARGILLLSTSQWISLVLIVLAVCLIMRFRRSSTQ